MTERTSERIWRAARAAYESRVRSPNAAMLAPSEALVMDWKKVSQARRDIEYDAMVTAFGVVPPLLRLEARIAELEADQEKRIERARRYMNRIVELEAELERCRTPATPPDFENILDAAGKIKDRISTDRVRFLEGRIDAAVVELQQVRVERDRWKALAERFMTAEHQLSDAYLRLREMIPGALELEVVPDLRYGDNVPWAHTEACLKRLVEDRDEYKQAAEVEAGLRREARAALKPFAEYAERIEKERPGWKMAPIGIPMAWFIAALKVCRGEPAPPAEDKT